jgi:hypothetical protein
MQHPAPERPRDIDPLAEAMLTQLQSFPAARHIVLGGYFALKHYCDYRITHDVDAWWAEESREADREQVRAALKAVFESLASERGLTVNRRQFGDTESWELLRAGTTLDTLTDPVQRERAEQTRAWFRAVFLHSSQA